jgi:membrane protein CcdC involved in cytochrome C biogenesis
MNYRLPAGKSVKIITPLVFLIPSALLIWFYTLELSFAVLIAIPLFIIFSVVYAYTPKEVVLENDKIVIKKQSAR